MLKTKDKRFICLVILSVSIVSLLTALVSGFVGRMVILCSNYTSMYVLEAALSLAHIALGLAFALLFFLCKKRQNLVNLIMTCVNAVVFVVFCVVLGIETYNVTVYTAISLTIMISATFMTVTKWLLLKYDEDEKVISENTNNE